MLQENGLATQTIDTFYALKLALCKEWDRSFGLKESHPCSAVGTLNFCYTVRRPGFQMADEVMKVLFKK